MEDQNLLEAQFWWAFSCLAVVGRRDQVDFHAEVLRRNLGGCPDAAEVDSIVQEACGHLPSVLNRVETGDVSAPRLLSGWERHILALSTKPGN
jgi:hypothetical protein